MDPVDQILALLFVADAPASLASLAAPLGYTEGQVEQALELLDKRLKKSGPLQLVTLAGGYQISTKPAYAEIVSAFLKPQRQRLSRSLMEVLAIIAYKQPMTMAEIDAVRGVQSDYSVKALLERRLVQETGRRATPGRPVLYGTSAQFLHQFNMSDLSQLPPLESEPRALEARVDELE
ncbi:SMC-Scp complex subunit ScpB [Fimbriimonas ginsengisoli]|uniref:Segregation and condensation protein B n=1 Tax=Fimbriimonas ginsengisoli Gsoil 348 TaxID=661478 RepID=A0A068NW09_FIMGI|nr:SMC-Scp complex subunit ScpB [Fimbriimonas ginsengisoli]AIE86965.1 Segregation and condensation protein B [Fimbriimonas ginsengisoli Gsoil 348]